MISTRSWLTLRALLTGVAVQLGVYSMGHDAAAAAAGGPLVEIEWGVQIGSLGYDDAESIARDDDGYLYVTGPTEGYLGSANRGASDIFLSKYAPGGSLIWTRQYGERYADIAAKLTYDSHGYLYLTGRTTSDLAAPWAGGTDGFVLKVDLNGDPVWTQQFGTSADEFSSAAVTDSAGNVYISGRTGGGLSGQNAGSDDAFVAKYLPDGQRSWIRQFGTPAHDESFGVAVDGHGNIVVAGSTQGSLDGANQGSQDMYVRRYGPDGTFLTGRQIGTPYWDKAFEATTDEVGNVYTVGWTRGDLAGPNAGEYDAVVLKFDAAGELLWSTQLGSSEYEYAFAISATVNDGVYLSGYQGGYADGVSPFGGDIVVSKLTSDGDHLWDFAVASSEADHVSGVVHGTPRSAYLVGGTRGNLFGMNQGGADAILFKIVEAPEPTVLASLSVAAAVGVGATARRRVSTSAA